MKMSGGELEASVNVTAHDSLCDSMFCYLFEVVFVSHDNAPWKISGGKMRSGGSRRLTQTDHRLDVSFSADRRLVLTDHVQNVGGAGISKGRYEMASG